MFFTASFESRLREAESRVLTPKQINAKERDDTEPRLFLLTHLMDASVIPEQTDLTPSYHEPEWTPVGPTQRRLGSAGATSAFGRCTALLRG